MLTDNEILKLIKEREIVLEPFNRDNLGANSYDLTINENVRILNQFTTMDISKDIPATIKQTLPVVLSPHDTIIFKTNEIVGCKSKTLGILSTRSNLSRFPLPIWYSNLVDTGFTGFISGAITNINDFNIVIPKNFRIMQVMFMRTDGKVEQSYLERKWSKNTAQFGDTNVPEYKIDKEWLSSSK